LLVIPAVVCWLEAAALLVVGAAAVFSPQPGSGSAGAQAVLFAVLAIGLVVMGVGLLRAQRWARGPLLATQLIVCLIAVSWAGLSSLLGWGLLVPAVASLAIVVLPGTAAVWQPAPVDDESA
jgi:hypothetical protein